MAPNTRLRYQNHRRLVSTAIAETATATWNHVTLGAKFSCRSKRSSADADQFVGVFLNLGHLLFLFVDLGLDRRWAQAFPETSACRSSFAESWL